LLWFDLANQNCRDPRQHDFAPCARKEAAAGRASLAPVHGPQLHLLTDFQCSWSANDLMVSGTDVDPILGLDQSNLGRQWGGLQN
jgi:hypothetical protein